MTGPAVSIDRFPIGLEMDVACPEFRVSLTLLSSTADIPDQGRMYWQGFFLRRGEERVTMAWRALSS
jgi:hypothetical protein